MNIFLTGGFTGGHIVPLIRLKQKLSSYDFYYVGFKNSLEERLSTKASIPFFGLTKINGRFKKYLCKGKYHSELEEMLASTKIDLVISTGGYHSFPLVSYCKKKNIKLILIEENKAMGLLNLMYRRCAYKMVVNFPIAKRKNIIYGPNPAIYYTPLKENIVYDYLVIGGSLGSEVLIKLAIELSLRKKKVLLIAGRYKESYMEYINEYLEILGFVNSIEYYKMAKMVITRAGSATLFELIKANTSFLIVPSESTKRNHQIKNAKYIYKRGMAYMMRENDLSIRKIIKLLDKNNTQMLKLQQEFISSFDSYFYEKIIRS